MKAAQHASQFNKGSFSPYIRGEGCGNTFLIFDCLDSSQEDLNKVLKEAHPLLLKENRDDALILKKEYQKGNKLVLTMIVLEPDQSIAEFCGNGARVVACYLKHKFGNRGMEFFLQTEQGEKKIWWDAGEFHVSMGKTRLRSSENKFLSPKFETFALGLGMRQFIFFWTETLEPHLVTFDEIGEEELYHLGLYLNQRQRSYFPLGISLNKAEILGENSLSVTTFERGVNRITAACGTGATSCAMLARASGRIKGDQSVKIILRGGIITIHPKESEAIMSGPAEVEY